MRWVVLLAVLGAAACVDQSQLARSNRPTLWHRTGDTQLASAPDAALAQQDCAEAMGPQAIEQSSVPPVANSPSWLDANRTLLNSPTFGQVSAPEMDTCMHSLGFERSPN